MGFLSKLKRVFRRLLRKKRHLRIGIYGPPNAGKTTLANRITRDWTGEEMGKASEVPHETRHVYERRDVHFKTKQGEIVLDIVDTPGVATKVDFHEFVEGYGMDEEEGRRRAKEATEGVIEAIKWLDDMEAVLLVMDASEDPYTQVNVTILGNLEARKIPVLIVANKIDLEDANPGRLRNAFPQHPVVPISALTGHNIDGLYREIVKRFG